MPGFTPFMQDGWDHTVGADADILGADDEVGDLRLFVGGDAFVFIVPFGQEQANETADQLREIADDAGGERLVGVVPQAEHPAVVIAGFLGVEFYQAEVALAFMRQRVCQGADAQVGVGQCLLDRGDELLMWDGAPAWVWRGVETARTSSRSTCEAPHWSVRFGARRWMSWG